jgi:hypothetical protein
MYSPLIIKTKLSAIQTKIDLRDKTQRFSLKEFAVAESRAYIDHLQSRTFLNEKTKKYEIKDLTQIDLNFIENERLICQNNFTYWCTHYAFIKSKLTDETETLILCNPNIPQRIIIDQWAESEEKFHAIMMLYLKARQGGVSTINELAIAHRVQFHSRVNALIASSDPDKTKKLAGMMKLVWEMQPFWMLPTYKISESKEVWAVFENGSSVTCQHGTAMSGIARGETPDVAHLSELPDFRDPIEDVDAALLNAVHENPSTFIVLESTAKGKTGQGEWWYEKWKFATKWFPRNKTRLKPIFLPYFTFVDVWPTKTWCNQFLPSNLDLWEPSELTKAHALKCAEYVASSPLLRKYLGAGWTLPLYQQYWWEFTRREFEENEQLNKFLEEMCSTPDEAFQRTGRGVFSLEQIEWLRAKRKPLATYYEKPAVFGIIGDGISPEDEPLVNEIDLTRPYITIKVDWEIGAEPKTYRLLPLKHDPDLWNNRLFIWDFPSKSSEPEVATGVDGAEGLEGMGDNSVIEVVNKMTMFSPSEQMAEFVSCTLSTAQLLPFTLAIGTFYSSIEDGSINQCRQVIETNFGGGAGLQHQLRLAGWGNFHRWEGAYQSAKRKSSNSIGWETNTWTRVLLTTQVVKAIKDGAFRVHSPFLIEELSNLQRDSESTRIEAKGKDHDDRAFASFFAFFSLHAWELYLMSKGDVRTREMFSSYDSGIPQVEGEVVSLNTSISKIEDKHRDIGKVDHYLISNTLPTIIASNTTMIRCVYCDKLHKPAGCSR